MQTGRLYNFRVRARNDVGLSLSTAVSTFMASRVPDQPLAPYKVDSDQTFITIAWVPPSDDGGSPITGYRVLWNSGGEGEEYFEIYTCDETVLTYTRDELQAYSGLPFKWKVIAVNYQGDSLESDSIRILAAEVPAAPLKPEKVAADKTFITVRWEKPNFNGGVPIESY